MDTPQTIYGRDQQQDQQANYSTQEKSHEKRNLILKNKALHVNLKATHIEVSDGVLSQVYGIHHIKALYIHKEIPLSITDVYEISRYLPIYFIDARGTILARYQRMYQV